MRGWVNAACWCSHRGGAKERQTLQANPVATGTGLVRGWEGVVIDRYVGKIVHERVSGCRFHPRSTERSFDAIGVWAQVGEPDLLAQVEMDTPLHDAAEDGDVEEVIMLVEEGADRRGGSRCRWR